MSSLRGSTMILRRILLKSRFSTIGNIDKPIGLVGVGHMGEKIAKNLAKDGYIVHIYDLNLAKLEALESPSITPKRSLDEISKKCSIIISILPNDEATKSVSTKLLETSSSASLCHISCSTVSPTTSRSMALLYQSKLNHHFISAPVFARPDGLSKRQATWMISGNAQGRDIAHNLLSSIGKTVDYGDDVGAANVVKLCGNFLIAASIESIAESMALAEKHGVDRLEVMKLLSSTIFDCLIYKGYGERVSKRDHRPGGFSLDLGLKDVTLISQAAREVNVPMPILSNLLDRYVSAKARGRGEMDWSAIGLSVAEDSGIDVSSEIEANFDHIKHGRKYE